MTISVPVSQELITVLYTDVVDTTDVFNNTIQASFAEYQKFKYNDAIYQNVGDQYFASTYSATVTPAYQIGDIVYKDGYVNRITETEGSAPRQPSEYASVDSGFDTSTFANEFTKVREIPVWHTDGVEDWTHNPSAYTIDMQVSDDGHWTYEINTTDNVIIQYYMATAWDLANRTYSGVEAHPSSGRFFFGNNGSILYKISDNGTLTRENLSTAWDVRTSGGVATTQTGFSGNSGGTYNATGTKLYLISKEGYVYEYNVLTAWSSAGFNLVHVGTVQVGTLSTYPYNNTAQVHFSSNGLTMFIVERYSNYVYQYSLSTAWSPSAGITFTGKKYISSVDAISWSPDGTKMFALEGTSDKIVRFTSPTAFDAVTSFDTIFPILVKLPLVTYNISQSTFVVYSSGGNYSESINSYDALDNNSIISDAYLIPGTNDFLGKTMVVNTDAVYIRTHIGTPIYDTFTDYKTAVVVSPADLKNFVEVGKTNNYNPFDGKNYSVATSTTASMAYTLESSVKFDTLALGNVVADSAIVRFRLPSSSDSYDLWLDGASVVSGGNGIATVVNRSIDTSRDINGDIEKWKTTELFYSEITMEAGSSVEIELTIATGEIIELGTILVGMSVDNGTFTNLAMSHTYKDFSVAQYDTWGNLDYVERQRINTYNGTVDVPIVNYDKTVRLMTSLGKKLVIVNGSKSKTIAPNSQSVFSSTQMIGRFMSFQSKTKIKDNDIERMAEYSFTLEELA